jgi:hypothetical protein
MNWVRQYALVCNKCCQQTVTTMLIMMSLLQSLKLKSSLFFSFKTDSVKVPDSDLLRNSYNAAYFNGSKLN